jgi:hypothetical protein
MLSGPKKLEAELKISLSQKVITNATKAHETIPALMTSSIYRLPLDPPSTVLLVSASKSAQALLHNNHNTAALELSPKLNQPKSHKCASIPVLLPSSTTNN